jgi:hypothetical protein
LSAHHGAQIAVFGLVAEVGADGKDELARAVKVYPGIPGTCSLAPPELVQQKGVKAVVARMEGEDVLS